MSSSKMQPVEDFSKDRAATKLAFSCKMLSWFFEFSNYDSKREI